MRYKRDIEKIKLIVEKLKSRYGFRGPLHFTDFSNLDSIFKSGFVGSREYCETNGINFLDVADQEVIEHTNFEIKKCTRFYYKEKTPTLYRNEGIKGDNATPHVPIPVYLLFDEEILYFENTIFSNGNAGSYYTDFGNNSEFFENMGWNLIFHRGPIYEGEDKILITRKRNAELLSLEPIELRYLKKIIFRCETDRKRAIYKYGNSSLYDVESNMFNNYNNYIKDYNIIVKDDIIKINLELQRLKSKYSIKLIVENEEKESINKKIKNKSVIYKDIFNAETEDSSCAISIDVIYKEKIDELYKVKVYMNNNLSIEDCIKRYNIKDFSIDFEENNMLVKLTFSDEKICFLNHSYQILDNDNNVVKNNIINFPENSKGVSWIITVENYDKNWNRFIYYIDNVLCVDEIIEKEENSLLSYEMPF